MLLIILLGLFAIVLGALVAVTTVRVSKANRQPGDPAFRFVFTVVWPSGPVTYSWPKETP